MAANTITGGGFQDSAGNVIASGRLTLRLSAPATDPTSTIQICNDFECGYDLDANGNVVSGSAAWPNDQILPSGTYYMATVYSETGELAWGPNAVYILSTPSPFVISSWVPSNPV